MNRTSPPARDLLGVGLCLTLAVAFLLLGSTRPWAQAVLHVGIGLCAILAYRLDARQLANGGTVLLLVRPCAVVLGVVVVGLVPLPAEVLDVVAPGIVEARPEVSWATLSLVPTATVGELCTLGLVLSFGLLVGLWGTGRRLAQTVEYAVIIGTAGICLFAAVHLAFHAEAVLGILEPRDDAYRLFAPLVNPNHFGTVLVMALPIVLARTVKQGRRAPHEGETAALAIVLVGVLALLVAVRSPGVLTAALVVGLLLVIRPRSLVVSGLAATAAMGTIIGFFAWAWPRWIEPDWETSSITWRLAWLSDAPAAFADHWLAGFGAGTFSAAFRAYREADTTYRIVRHAHNDLLEWVLETGVVGLVGLGLLVVWVLYRLPSDRPHRRAHLFSLGLVGLAIHAVLDFPLQIPAIAMLGAGFFAVRWTVYERARAGRPTKLRALIAIVGLVQVPMFAWQASVAVADAASARVLKDRDRTALRVLEGTAPWRPEVDIARLRTTTDPEVVGQARRGHPHDPEVLREAALAYMRIGDIEAARETLDRAVTRDPNDPRTWSVRYQLALRQGDPQAAAGELAKAFRHYPRQLIKRETLGEAYSLWPLSMWWLDALGKADFRWSVHLGSILFEQGDYEMAVLAFEQAAMLDPKRASGMPAKGRALLRLGQVQQAEAHARQGIAAGRYPSVNYLVLAEALEEQGRHREAADAILASYKLDKRRYRRRDAVRMIVSGHGQDAGIAFIEDLSRKGLGGRDLELLEAELHLDAGRPAMCRHLIESRGLMGQEGGTALYRRCREPAEQ